MQRMVGAMAAVVCWGSAAAQPQPLLPQSMVEVYRSASAQVQVAERPASEAKAGAVAGLVYLQGLGAPLVLQGGVQAASALAQLQVRCRGGVWAVEGLTAYDGPQASGAVVMTGQSPAGQLSWHRIHDAGPSQPGLLRLWLGMAAARICAPLAAEPGAAG